jgi:hypothetical protein
MDSRQPSHAIGEPSALMFTTFTGMCINVEQSDAVWLQAKCDNCSMKNMVDKQNTNAVGFYKFNVYQRVKGYHKIAWMRSISS